MRLIIEKIISAFNQRRPLSISNTVTDGDNIWLHNHKIVKRKSNGDIWISTCGFNTQTTFSRLNAIEGVSVCKRKGKVILNGSEWDGQWINITKLNELSSK